MRRFLLAIPLVAAFALLAVADDTPKAAATRKKLDQPITVLYKDTLLRDVIDDLKEKVEGLGILADTKGGVNLNSKISYKAEEKPAREVLDGICDKFDLGYLVISQQGTGYDGSLKLTRGKERGYAEGSAPSGKDKSKDKTKDVKESDKTKDKTKDKPKDDPFKTEDKPKEENKPKAEEKPAEDDGDKLEGDAARRLKFAKEFLEDGKVERAKERLEEIVKRYPKTKAATEAKELLEKLDK